LPKICLLVHGILSSAKDSGPAKLEPYFQQAGYWTLRIPVGWGFLVLPALRNRTEGAFIAAFAILLHDLGNDVYAVGHSNGARICALASQYGAPFEVLAFIDAALDKEVKIGKQVGGVLNAHVPDDAVLAIAAMIPFHPWGSLGRSGFKPDSDPRCWNANLGSGNLPGAKGIKLEGHSDFFKAGNIEKLGPWLVKTMEWLAGKG
jgi:pimeloyl-ACP methyl ester carboxylesterase